MVFVLASLSLNIYSTEIASCCWSTSPTLIHHTTAIMWITLKEVSVKLLRTAIWRREDRNTDENDNRVINPAEGTLGPADADSDKEFDTESESDNANVLNAVNTSQHDDDQSQISGSTTPNSTSTYQYCHEPYETYQHRIKVLIDEIGGREVQLMERIRGGSSNRIIPVKFTRTSAPATIDTGILRIPRFSDLEGAAADDENVINVDKQILRQVSVLQFLGTHQIPIPKVLAFDATARNAIESPYALIEFTRGERLDEIYDQLSYSERRTVVDEIVDFLVEMDSIEFATSGRFCPSKEQETTAKDLALFNTSNEAPKNHVHCTVGITGFGTNPWGLARPTKPMDSLYHMLREQFTEQMNEASMKDKLAKSVNEPILGKLLSILENMKDMDYFPANGSRNVLHHGDFEPRNLLVVRGQQDKESIKPEALKLNTVLDWDDALVLPSILTRRPLTWIWDFSDVSADDHDSIASDYDEDYDLFDPHRYDACNGRLSNEDQAMRAYFEQAFVEKLSRRVPNYDMETYYDEAYGKGYWLRRLARFAINGITSSFDLRRFERLAREWDEFKTCN